jgi:hypothetical protein
MSDSAIAQICTTIVTVVIMVLGYLKLKNGLEVNATKADVAASSAQQVKRDLAASDVKSDKQFLAITATIDSTAKAVEATAVVANVIHQLTNSSLLASLAIAKDALAKVAVMTGKPEDILAAQNAAKSYDNQQRKQDVVDGESAKQGA